MRVPSLHPNSLAACREILHRLSNWAVKWRILEDCLQKMDCSRPFGQ
jgi:hypothetical protein